MRAEGRALSLILIGLPELVSWAEHDRVQSRMKAGLPGRSPLYLEYPSA